MIKTFFQKFFKRTNKENNFRVGKHNLKVGKIGGIYPLTDYFRSFTQSESSRHREAIGVCFSAGAAIQDDGYDIVFASGHVSRLSDRIQNRLEKGIKTHVMDGPSFPRTRYIK